jgi:radical SAM protein with 4Fe4S-binding SPASM domain
VTEKKVKKFHQFIVVEKGPVNAAVLDLLKGNVYQVEKDIVEKLENRQYTEISPFIEAAEQEQMLIDITPNKWVPEILLEPGRDSETPMEDPYQQLHFELHVDEGENLERILEKLKNYDISKCYYYGTELPESLRALPNIEKKNKDFQECLQKTRVEGDFCRITEGIYLFNKKYNSCWGRQVAVTGNGSVRPCLFSDLIVGNLYTAPVDPIIRALARYWNITKDQVERCKECELRYVCFDCREIARRKNGGLYSPNPLCNYEPTSGTWTE